MTPILEKISIAQSLFRSKMVWMLENGGLTKERYYRFLSMQFNLTFGVQKVFFRIAAHSAIGKRRDLRKWLLNFGQEEEFHFELAKADLKELGQSPGECPFDTKLWWLYFETVIDSRPFVRLGAACVLENISGTSSEIISKLISGEQYLNPRNLRFLITHQHGPNLDHGNQIIEIIRESELSDEEMADLAEGAEIATNFYLRFMHWATHGEVLR